MLVTLKIIWSDSESRVKKRAFWKVIDDHVHELSVVFDEKLFYI